MKIYQVVIRGGSYEDEWESVCGTYLSKERAHKRLEEVHRDIEAEKIKELDCRTCGHDAMRFRPCFVPDEEDMWECVERVDLDDVAKLCEIRAYEVTDADSRDVGARRLREVYDTLIDGVAAGLKKAFGILTESEDGNV